MTRDTIAVFRRRPREPTPAAGSATTERVAAAPAVSVQSLSKTYESGFQALRGVSLEIRRGEIFALLGPNGAGKTTLIGIICGLIMPGEGSVAVNGYDILRDWRITRSLIGLVPQELATDTFETVSATVSFSRGLFGKPPNAAHIEQVLRDLSLWDKRNDKIQTLSGGMKRRLLIAKALAHEPDVLFLDEPTAGVDVELRRDMWALIRALRDRGVTIILTTHYIEEAEDMADRVGVIQRGQIVLVEETAELMRQLGRKALKLHLKTPLDQIPTALAHHQLELSADGMELTYTFTAEASDRSGVAHLLQDLSAAGIAFRDLHTEQSSLEDIFVDLVREQS